MPTGWVRVVIVGVRTWIEGWPVYRQLTGTDPLGRGAAAQSPRSRALTPRVEQADSVARSVCPYCAVGCGQRVFVKDGEVVQIEGDPDSPISRGRLCPKGSASKSLVTSCLLALPFGHSRPRLIGESGSPSICTTSPSLTNTRWPQPTAQ